jgi:hypothetical protein
MKIGQKVKVRRLKEKVPSNIIEKAQQGQEAVIKSFKMTDGSGIGVFVEFPDSTTSWFFEDEIQVVE